MSRDSTSAAMGAGDPNGEDLSRFDDAPVEIAQTTVAAAGAATRPVDVKPVPAPRAGETVVIPTHPTERLAFEFDPAKATVRLRGSDLVLEFGDGGVVVLEGFAPASEDPAGAPRILLPDGTVLAGNVVVVQLAAAAPGTGTPVPALEIAAGPTPSGGTSGYDDDLGAFVGSSDSAPNLVGALDALDSPPPDSPPPPAETRSLVLEPALPTLAIDDVTVVEGDAPIMVITVTLSAPSDAEVTVDFVTADGTAIAGGIGIGENDYDATSGTLTFAPGETTATIEIVINDDDVVEFDETFLVRLENAVNALIADGTGTGTIANDDPNLPPTISDAAFAIDENAVAGAVVGSTAAADPNPGQTVSFAIVGGNTGGAFAIDPVTGVITVASPAAVDFEANPVFALTVRATDNWTPSLSSDALVTISLNDVNEAPVVADQAFAVGENQAPGAVVGTVAASDQDAGDVLSYAIVGGTGVGLFAIDSGTGQITTTALLDHEAAASYTLTVQAGDGSLTDVATVAVNVSDLDEAPTVDDQAFAVAENLPAGTVVGTVAAGDPDDPAEPFGTLAYAIVGGTGAGLFAVDGTTGQITTTTPLDHETAAGYTLTVQVMDGGGLSDTATITIGVTDVNDAPVVNDQVFSVPENSAPGAAVGSVAASDQDGDALGYAIVGGSGAGLFAIDPVTGQITTTASLDHETAASYTLTVQVGDGDLSDTATVTVNVGDVNEPPTVEDQAFAVPENQPAGAVIGSVATSDPDAGEALTYAIIGGSGTGLFAINPVSGQITTTGPLDHEAADSYTLTVQVTDGGGLTDTATITIGVADLDEAPSIGDQAFAVAENESAGAVVGTVVASDPDDPAEPFGTLSYAIVGGSGVGLFTIDPATGQITTTAPLDHEAAASYALTVQATDAGGLSDTATVTISVGDVNEAPLVADQTLGVDENLAAGAVVGTVVASDPDAGAVLAYAITGGTGAGLFAIDPGTGQVTAAAPLDHESAASYTLTVEVSDGSLSDSATITVNVGDVNETPTVDDQVFAVAENLPAGTVVGSVAASDPDNPAEPFGTLAYAITGGSGIGLFAINPTTGEITTATPLDHEAAASYTLTVQVTDDGGQSDTATVTVDVGDVNEPPAVNDQLFAVDEGQAAGTVVGAVAASDPDAGDTLAFAITGGTGAGLFAIDGGTGQITTTAPLDHEATASYTLTVRASDGGGLQDTATITIGVGDVNETPAVDDQVFGVAENQPAGTVVGSVVATDPDNPAEPFGTLSYAIVGGSGAGLFAIDAATGEITTTSTLDHEATSSYALTVQVTDGDGLSDSATVTVNVGNVNEAPDVGVQVFGVDENLPAGTTVGTVVASDPDSGTVLEYAIVGGSGAGLFAINTGTGEITATTPLDHEAAASYTLTVQVGDGSLSDTATITVNVGDVDESPVVADQGFAVSESQPVGTVVGTVGATDPDNPAEPFGTLSYAIVAGNEAGLFAIDPSTGQITTTAILDADATPIVNLTVQVTDGGGLNDTATVAIDVVENQPPVAGDQVVALNENLPAATSVATVVASDPDPVSVLSYAITGGNGAGLFTIDAATGEITTTGPLDHETAATHVLTVTVSDNGTPSLSDTATVTVNVGDVNEAPAVADQAFAVAENEPAGTVVGTVAAADPDDPTEPFGTLSYAVTGGSGAGLFAVDSATGQITTLASLNHEAAASYTLTVQVSDGGALSDTATITIDVGDVNEPPTVGDQAFAVNENQPVGTAVGVVAAGDPDLGDALSFAITGGSGAGLFAINPATGQITTTAVLDHEAAGSYTLTVQVGDGSLTDTATVTVNVGNVNEAPSVEDQVFATAENQAPGAVVGTVAASDPDAGATLGYAIVGGSGAGLFAIDGTSGQITTTAPLDHESAVSYTLIVQVGDGSLTDTATITVNVTDVNDAPVVADQAFAVAENEPAGAPVGTVAAADPDAGATLAYAIVGGSGAGLFTIDGATGEITTAAPLDHESATSYTLTVQVDDGSLTDTATVTVNVGDVNEAPAVGDQVFAVNENQPAGTVVGSVVAADPDNAAEPFGTLGYAIIAGNDAGLFAIDPLTGQITTTAPLNYESAASHNLTVQVGDGGGLTDTAVVTVNVGDVNEVPVVDDQAFALNENLAGGTLVGTVVAGDPDAGSTLAYAIIAGNDAGLFAIDPNTGAITTTGPLDYEAATSHGLTVQVSDGSLTDTAVVTVNVGNVNEAPTDIVFAGGSVSENAANGTTVAVATGVDPDAGATITYSLIDNAGGRFAIDSSTGVITVANGGLLNYEAATSHNIVVRATDSGGLFREEALAISLVNATETGSTLSLSLLNGTNGFRLNGTATYDYAGASVSSAGDINGDGFDDLIIDAPYASASGVLTGSAFVVFGKSSGWAATTNLSTLNGSNGFRINGELAYDLAGYSVSSAGDINGDGLDDLLIGAAQTVSGYRIDTGTAYVVFGQASGWGSSINLSSLNGTNGFQLNGVMIGDVTGSSVSSAGDINGDGFGDFIVGAPTATVGTSLEGVAYIVFGKSSWTASVDLGSLNGSTGVRLDGTTTFGLAGISVQSAGDINGDGFDDVIIGAPDGLIAPYGTGEAFVVFGKSGGWSANLSLSTLNGTNGFRIGGVVSGDGAGLAVSSAGDVNGDGLDDLIVGAPGVGNYAGATYVVFGKTSGWSANFDLSTLNGTNGFRVSGTADGTLGGVAVASIGDVNGDGFDDLIIGASNGAYGFPTTAGDAYVIFGRGSGWTADVSVASLDGTNGFRLSGINFSDLTGFSVSGAGDVNGDGFDDMIVGAPGADPNGSFSGSSFVIFGGNFSAAVTFLGTSGADNYTGTSAAERVIGGQGNDTLIGGGGSDVFQAGVGDDLIVVGSTMPLQLDGGGGTDTARLDALGSSIDFTAISNSIFTGIEKLDLGGSAANTVTLRPGDVLDLSDSTNTLLVKGDAGDAVAGTGWTAAGSVLNPLGETGMFNVYTSGLATLLVEAELTQSAITA